jgi:hypothetical protein
MVYHEPAVPIKNTCLSSLSYGCRPEVEPWSCISSYQEPPPIPRQKNVVYSPVMPKPAPQIVYPEPARVNYEPAVPINTECLSNLLYGCQPTIEPWLCKSSYQEPPPPPRPKKMVYPRKMPQTLCQTNLMSSCQPTIEEVPCGNQMQPEYSMPPILVPRRRKSKEKVYVPLPNPPPRRMYHRQMPSTSCSLSLSNSCQPTIQEVSCLKQTKHLPPKNVYKRSKNNFSYNRHPSWRYLHPKYSRHIPATRLTKRNPVCSTVMVNGCQLSVVPSFCNPVLPVTPPIIRSPPKRGRYVTYPLSRLNRIVNHTPAYSACASNSLINCSPVIIPEFHRRKRQNNYRLSMQPKNCSTYNCKLLK